MIGHRIGHRVDHRVDHRLGSATPAPIALGALERWLSTQGVTAPSDKVSAWLGSINGIVASQATGANQMDYVENSANLGGPAVIPADGFDYVDTGSLFTGGELDNGLTVFIFGYCPVGMPAGQLCYTRAPSGIPGRSTCLWRADDASSSAAGVSTDDNTFAQVVRSTFGAGKIWVLYSYAPDGTIRARSSTYAAESATMPAGEDVTPTRFSIGSSFGAGAVAFEYREVVLFDRQLSIADEDAMATYGDSML